MEPTQWADPTGKGLMAGLDEFFDGPAKGDITPVVNISEPAKSGEPAPEPVKPAPKEEPVKAEEKKEEPIELIDEGFFKGEEKPEPATPEEFDEAAFDKETEEQTKGMDAKVGAAFKALKAEVKTLKQLAPAPELLKELEDAKTKAQEAEGLRERIKQLSGQSAKLYVENDDDYIKEVKEPWAAVHAKLDQLSNVYEMDPSILRSLVREDDRKVQDEMIKTYLTGFSDLSRQEVFTAVSKVGDLLEKHETAMKNAEANIGAIEAKRQQESEKLIAEQRKTVQSLTSSKWSRWEKAIPGLLDDKGEPTPEYAAMKSESLSLDFGNARAGDMAFAALSGVLLPFAQKQIVSLQRELAEFKKADKKALDGAPSSGSSVSQTPVDPKKPATFMEGFMAQDFVG